LRAGGSIDWNNAVIGTVLDAASAIGSMRFGTLTSGSIVLEAANGLVISSLKVRDSVDLAATDISVGGEQTPGSGVPLRMNVTGTGGTLGKTASIAIASPLGLDVGVLRVTDVDLRTSGPHVSIRSGEVPGALYLEAANRQIMMDNRDPTPLTWVDVQLYRAGGKFTLTQDGNRTVTDAYVIVYHGDASVTGFTGIEGDSVERSASQAMKNGQTTPVDGGGKSPNVLFWLGSSPSAFVDANQIPKAVESTVSGPAVNTDGLQRDNEEQ
jgi:hypothetical protein